MNETPNEKALSGALALVMHGLFFALLVFGVAWQKREVPPLMAELWSELPAPKVAPPPPPRIEPKPVPKAQPKPPPPKVEPKPDLKADIALREKKEKERKAKEQELAEKKRLAEKKKLEEQALAEKKKREEQAQLAKLKAQLEKERAEQVAREQDEALKRIAQAEQTRLVDEYKRRIADKIRSRITEVPGLKGNPEVEFDVVVLPGGEVLDVKLRRKSGQAAWDGAVERAIRLAQPLPLPPAETGLMREFRELNLKFRPKE